MNRSTDLLPEPPGHGRTLLVHGTAGPALALWAAGLARSFDAAFSWADIAPSPPGRDKVVRLLTARSSEGAWINGVTAADVLPPEVSASAVARLLGPNATAGRLPGRLAKYLGLPALLQLLAARSTRPDGTATILILGGEALGPVRLGATLGSPEVHRILRREGITCVVTFEGDPPESVAAQFDQVYRLSAPSAEAWTQSTVTATRGDGLPPELHEVRGLLAQWTALRLPTELLDIWALPGFSPVRPR